MSTITTLLVDIEHPDLDEPLYLMCGMARRRRG